MIKLDAVSTAGSTQLILRLRKPALTSLTYVNVLTITLQWLASSVFSIMVPPIMITINPTTILKYGFTPSKNTDVSTPGITPSIPSTKIRAPKTITIMPEISLPISLCTFIYLSPLTEKIDF